MTIKALIDYMKGRLADIDFLATQGVIPGQTDTYELEQLIGRRKELAKIIKVAEAMEADKCLS